MLFLLANQQYQSLKEAEFVSQFTSNAISLTSQAMDEKERKDEASGCRALTSTSANQPSASSFRSTVRCLGESTLLPYAGFPAPVPTDENTTVLVLELSYN